MKGQSGSLKVSSFPSFGFIFGCFLVCFVLFVFEKKKMTTMCCRLLLWWCCIKEKDDGNVPSSSSVMLL